MLVDIKSSVWKDNDSNYDKSLYNWWKKTKKEDKFNGHILRSFESESEVGQSCPTLCDPMDCSLPGSSVHGIFQARVLEWVAISPSKEETLNYAIIPEFVQMKLIDDTYYVLNAQYT